MEDNVYTPCYKKKTLFRLQMSVWFLILIWNLRVKCLAYVKHPFFISVIHLVYESIWAWRIPGLWSMHLSLVGWIMGIHCCTDFLNISKYLIAKLQVVLNCAARMILCKEKYDHATPLLIQFHWLPVSQCIIFEILLLTFKALKDVRANCFWASLLRTQIHMRRHASSARAKY